MTDKATPIFFWLVSGFILVGSIWSLFFFSDLIPLNFDEAGYWFNFTNKNFKNRNLPIDQIPNHTIPIYLAKLSLPWLGHTGIGLRLPVILFGVLDAVLLFFWIRHLTDSSEKGLIGACFLLLLPWFTHHAHEFRGYTAYILFCLISFFSLRFLLLRGDKIRYWILLMISFLGCYYSSLGSVIFIFNFMATLWILKFWQIMGLKTNRVNQIAVISLKSLFLFSVIAILIMVYIMFVLDAYLILKNREYQYAANSKPLLLMLDVFSTFLGYSYLDDPDSLIYRYPASLYVFSMLCCVYGLWITIREKMLEGTIFIILFSTTILFAFLIGHGLQTRAICYFLPFIVLFQTLGFVFLINSMMKQIFKYNKNDRIFLWISSLILIVYFTHLNIGKYLQLDAGNGNPFELARDYLEENSGPNDLVISSISDTISAFYFGETIRKKNKAINDKEQLSSIYYVTSNGVFPPKIFLENYLSEKKYFLGFDGSFKAITSFTNKGRKGGNVFIFKMDVEEYQAYSLGWDVLLRLNFFGDKGSCEKKKREFGMQLFCPGSSLVCSEDLKFLGMKLDGFVQLILFSHINDSGSRIKTMISLEEVSKGSSFLDIGIGKSFSDNYFINFMVDDEKDLDSFDHNVNLFSPYLQKIEHGQEFHLCAIGDLFRNNSFIDKVLIINFKPE